MLVERQREGLDAFCHKAHETLLDDDNKRHTVLFLETDIAKLSVWC